VQTTEHEKPVVEKWEKGYRKKSGDKWELGGKTVGVVGESLEKTELIEKETKDGFVRYEQQKKG